VPPGYDIPQQRSSLTAAWFNRSLAGLPSVRSLRLEDVARQGMMSDVVRLVPGYANSDASVAAPRSLVVKLSATDQAMRMRGPTRLSYRREVSFYQQLQATFDVSTPRCYLAEVDFETGYHVLVLEDLSTATQRPLISGCSLAEARLAVVELARLHARWWDSAELASLDWLPEVGAVEEQAARDRHRQWWPEFLEQAGHLLGPDMIEFADLLADGFAPLMNHLLFSPPRTLRHGDYGLSNLLFDYRSSGGDTSDGPDDIIVIDWQTISRGKGPWDLAWFLGQSLTVAQRRSWEKSLLKTYHATLVDRGVAGYDLDTCQADYARALAQRFGTLISSLVALPFSASQKAEIREVQLPRNLAAIADHGGCEILKGLV